MSPDFKEQRTAAFIPFALLCATLVVALTIVKVNEMNRPALKTLDEMRGGQAQSQQPAQSPMEGKPVPDLQLPLLTGGKMSLAAMKGKVLFVNVWATWCAPCREEMPSMERLNKQLKGENFAMIAISIDKDGAKSVAPFAKELGLTFPILLDPEQKAAGLFKITGVPETFLVGQDGTILHHIVGPTDWDRPAIVDALKTLAQRPAAGTKK